MFKLKSQEGSSNLTVALSCFLTQKSVSFIKEEINIWDPLLSSAVLSL